MGIRGLTTYIKSNRFMESYQLHDCYLVVDGCNAAIQLYIHHCKANDCFNGDYDKYARVVHNFFNILSECNVTPLVVFDGGYEPRKFKTIFDRMRNRISTAHNLNAVTEGYYDLNPLFTNELFKDIVQKLNIKCVQCDYEADNDTASIARELKCPVLSLDSDYFIFDVDYIPFDTLDQNKRKNASPSYYYIACQKFSMERFLRKSKGLTRAHLPLFATLLGNDYITRQKFTPFFRSFYLGMSQDGIQGLIHWLQQETVQSAIDKIVQCFPEPKRKHIRKIIFAIMDGYTLKESPYLEYILEKYAQVNKVNNNESLDNSEEFLRDSDEESEEESIENFPIDDIFRENFRKVLYPSCFMDMLSINRFYCVTQIENDREITSHSVSFDIIAAMYKILTNLKGKQLLAYGRDDHKNVKRYVLPVCELNLPTFKEIQTLTLNQRKELFMYIVNIDEIVDLSKYPPSWHIFIITIKYLVNKNVLQLPHVLSLCLCAIYINYVDPLAGYCRSTTVYTKKYSSIILTLEIAKIPEPKANFADSVKAITKNDALYCLSDLINYFQMDMKMRQYVKMFNRKVVHTYAQFQSALLYIKHLNSLLNRPFQNILVCDFIDGTFLYNMTLNLAGRDLNTYFDSFLRKSPTVLNLLKFVVSKDLIGNLGVQVKSSNKRRRKKKNVKEVNEDNEVNAESTHADEENIMIDPNNKFSLLSISDF